MRVEVQGTKQTSRQLRKLHEQLSPEQQKWVFTQLLDDMYVIQRLWWAKKFGSRRDKTPRTGNPPEYMVKSGDLKAAATGPKGASSYNQATDKFAILSVQGAASKLADIHRSQGRDVIAEITRRDARNLTESMGRFIFAAAGR